MTNIIKINPKYKEYAPFFKTLPQRFLTEGTDLYKGRNHVKSFWVGKTRFVVKRFKHLGVIRRFIYTYIRRNKAIRSYDNSAEIIRRGFCAPAPVAYIAIKKGGLLDDLYYVSEYTNATAVAPELIGKEPCNEQMVEAYVRYIVALHTKGIIHHDLNFTNVLYKESPSGNYSFELIDVNRMSFYKGAAPKKVCLGNFPNSLDFGELYKEIIKRYVQLRGWGEKDYELGLTLKHKSDRHAKRKRKLKAFFKRG